MSDDKKINKSVDSFSEYIRNRLKTHSTPPDENCWNEIEQRLHRKRKYFPVRIALTIAASMFAAVLLIYNIIINDKDETQYAFIEKSDIPIQNPVSKDISYAGIIDKTEEINDKYMENKNDAGFSKKRIVNNISLVISDKQIEEANEQEKKTISTTEEKITETPEKEETKSTAINKSKYADEFQTSENMLVYDVPTDKLNRKKTWQINAGFGTGAGATNSSVNFSGRPPSDDYFGDGSNGNIGQQPGYETMRNITNIDCAIPISMSLTVRRKITKTIGIETGLIYTYLSTDYDITNNMSSNRAILKLHYLGIPANLIVNLWDKRQWNLYLSGGGMAEKGLQAISKQKSRVNNYFQQRKERSNISGLQWSLNGGIGISYNIYKDVNLYVEPVISYFFDCNQPLSKRTEDPLNFSIRAGIRYDF